MLFSGENQMLMCYSHFLILGGIVSHKLNMLYVRVCIRFVFAHLHMKCRHAVILEYFGEEVKATVMILPIHVVLSVNPLIL